MTIRFIKYFVRDYSQLMSIVCVMSQKTWRIRLLTNVTLLHLKLLTMSIYYLIPFLFLAIWYFINIST